MQYPVFVIFQFTTRSKRIAMTSTENDHPANKYALFEDRNESELEQRVLVLERRLPNDTNRRDYANQVKVLFFYIVCL